jgi:glycerophosphoryl diester phosphodiesterase
MRLPAAMSLMLLACSTGGEVLPELSEWASCPQELYGDGVCDAVCEVRDVDCAFQIIGHRGAPHRAAENTLPALEAALEEGANALEIDLCLTADQEVIVWHDRDPDDVVAMARQGGFEKLAWIPWVPDLGDPLRRPVDELPLAEFLASYGYARSEGPLIDATRTGTRDPSAVVPLLSDVSSWARRQPTLGALYLDVKLGPAQSHLVPIMAAAFARETDRAVYDVLILSPHETIVVAFRDWFRANRPDHRAKVVFDKEVSGALEPTVRLGLEAISIGRPITADPARYVTMLATLLASRDADHPDIWPVVAWTFDDAAELRELVRLGVDGIMTNRPAELARIVADEAARVERSSPPR